MTRATALRAALTAAVTALLFSPLVAFPGTAHSAAPDPREDHYVLPDACLQDSDTYVPGKAGACYVTPFRPARPTVVLWGDSHAWQHLPAIDPLARKRKVNLVLFMLGGCPPILIREHYQGKLYGCEKSNQMALKYVRDMHEDGKQVRVLLGAFWDGYYKVYKGVYVDKPQTVDPSDYTVTQLRSARTFHTRTPRLIAELGRIGVRTDLIGQATSVPADAPTCLTGSDPYTCALKRRAALPREGLWKKKFRQMVRQLPAGSRVVNNFTSTYCTKKKCHGRTDGVYTYFDPTHLSASRTATFKKFYAPTFWFGRK